jgi:pimeloyl-ACP methyl ester carboxylesterase
MRVCTVIAWAWAIATWQVVAPATSETHPGLTTSYETLTLRDGVKLQIIVTKPANAGGRLPAIQFVQWLSCDTVGISTDPRDGWSAMLRRIVRESNALVWRTEKRGVGASEGACGTMDYDTEFADHRDAFEQLRRRPDVDPRRIVIFGGSIGGTYAPLIAADQDVAGVMIWGAGATTWAERMLKFERNALELGVVDAKQMAREMSARFQFLDRYLIKGETPAQIAAADATLGAVWTRIVGTSPTAHYGRPFAFHQQAQRADWAAAWSRVRAPVLAVHGAFDWFESRDAASLIARIVNAMSPGRGTFVEIPGMNHHFWEFKNAADAFNETNGRVNPDPAVEVMLTWLREIFGRRASR